MIWIGTLEEQMKNNLEIHEVHPSIKLTAVSPITRFIS